MRNLLWWTIGGFVVYELVAWRVNDSRVAAAARVGGNYTPMPFDLIGKYVGYPTAGLGPEIPAVPVAVARGLADPAAARGMAFNSTSFPGIAAMPAPAFNPSDPLGLGL